MAAGTDAACIGLYDCANRRFLDVWVGYGTTAAGLSGEVVAEAVERALRTIVSLRQPDPALGGGSAQDARAERTTWVKSHTLLAGIGPRHGNIVGVCALHSASRGQMDTPARQNLVQIGLTYAQQLMRGQDDSDAPARSQIPEIILRSLSFGFAVVDGEGTLDYVNEASERWLRRRKELIVRDGRISARKPRNQQRLLEALRAATSGPRRTSVLLMEDGDGRARTLIVMPISRVPTRALIIFGREKNDQAMRDLLLESFGLTMAERRLARQLLTGKSLADAAAEANLTISTARSYLKRIFAKTGMHRQGQLIALYHSLMPPVEVAPNPAGDTPSGSA